MIVGIADTHTVIWYFDNDSRLSSTARKFIQQTADNGDVIGVSSISLVEIVYLIEKGKIASESFTRLAAGLNDSQSVLVEISLNLSIARTLTQVSAAQVPDMPDRIIAATAVNYRVPLISRDAKIQASSVQTIW
jgi:PIN domain nuclease of toxin-antitoxin system